jgi:hypothetical protein
MMRYIRAFFTALRMTIQGERVILPYKRLRDWLTEAEKHSAAALKAVQTADQIKVKVDGREQDAQTILKAVHYHVVEEYPYLLDNLTEHSITAIYANNMNDQYAIARLTEDATFSQAAARQAIEQLNQHLHAIPPSNDLAGPAT